MNPTHIWKTRTPNTQARIGHLLSALGGIALALHTSRALACGCFAPPIPTPEAANFAVNQQAEQIIFEVEDETVSAHVRIFYQGDPDEFAWLLPMPNVPDLELSNGLLFGLIDQQTTPLVSSRAIDLCPQQPYICRTHPPCPSPVLESGSATSIGAGAPNASPSFDADGAGAAAPPPVVVLAQERIGSYDTVTFAADEADLAIGWLNENGFIINETMSPYMQPYLDSGMVFIASKLVPGADVDEIRPLKLTYQADSASIPLQLTAIAAEPHMLVTAFIYSSQEFAPLAEPLTVVPAEQVVVSGRSNYPLLMARSVDEAGGNAFVKEYVGPGPLFQDTTGCCTGGGDWCGAGGDGVCQCPGTDFDASDCAEAEELSEAVSVAAELQAKYSTLTRLSTRVSPEEMTFNPEFVPAREPTGSMRLNLAGEQYTLGSCEPQVIDTERYEQIRDTHAACSTMYCDYGECVLTAFGAGCACGEGFAARTFTDVDGTISLTCVPERGTVDFAAGGIELPDVCEGVEVNEGECVDIGGFAATKCDAGLAAVRSPVGGSLGCTEILHETGDPGARNFSVELEELEVCAPPPPVCPANGWLEEREITIAGVDCGEDPDPSWFEVPPAPDCSAVSEPETSGSQVNAPLGPSGAVVSAGEATSSSVVDTAAPRPEAEADASEPAEAEFASESGDGDGVCSVGKPGGRAQFQAWWLAAAAMLLARRRPSRR